MEHVPIPTDRKSLEETAPFWQPFIASIVQKTKQSEAQVLDQIVKGEVALHLAYEPDENKAYALAGVTIFLQGEDRVARFMWMTGFSRQMWTDLLPSFETYHKEHLGCVEMRALCRPGWKNELKKQGYRVTHLLMEKRL